MPRAVALFTALLFPLTAFAALAADPPRPYRLSSVPLKEPLLWGYELREPAGSGLAFGGMDQDAEDGIGDGHTRILVDGEWKRIDAELRKNNPLQKHQEGFAKAAREARALAATLRAIYFAGLPAKEEEARHDKGFLGPRIGLHSKVSVLRNSLQDLSLDEHSAVQRANAAHYALQATIILEAGTPFPLSAKSVMTHQSLSRWLELAAECCGSEPLPRAMNCGRRSGKNVESSKPQPMVYDPTTKCYYLFGGDHLDYLTNDLWVFDPAKRQWFQKHPKMAPPPRANHRLELVAEGKIQLRGGYTYTSSTDYVGGQYIDLPDEAYYYDLATNTWTGGERLVPGDTRTYRTGPFHPDHFLQDEKPDAAKFQAFLKELPVNRWVVTNPLQKPELNRDWGCARIDPTRDLLLRWSGGHSAHGGTDVPHFHFATNRWELAFPVEFPLGQLYDNTEYPRGVNFNRRPWMTGHTYQNYEFDPPSGKMVQTGEEKFFNVYDPGTGDWVGRGRKPEAMSYGSCFYTLTLVATPRGAICWGNNGRVHRFVAKENQWVELELTGDKLPGANVDHSTIAYDSQRDRVLCFNAPGYAQPYQGRVWAIDLASNAVKDLSTTGFEMCPNFSHIDRGCYVPKADIVLVAAYLKNSGDWTRTPAFDCANNRWITLDLKYDATRHNAERTDRAFPHNHSCGLVYDPQRELLWGTDTHGQIYVLRLDLAKADPQLGQ